LCTPPIMPLVKAMSAKNDTSIAATFTANPNPSWVPRAIAARKF